MPRRRLVTITGENDAPVANPDVVQAGQDVPLLIPAVDLLGNDTDAEDDVLDYRSDPEEMGKNIGDDLAEGKPTLPLIYAMRTGTPEQATAIRMAIEQGGLERIEQIGAAIESTGALAYTSRLAQAEANRAIAAIEALPDSPFKAALVGLAVFSANRSY